jgi:outer membrane protein assembly factor BamB
MYVRSELLPRNRIRKNASDPDRYSCGHTVTTANGVVYGATMRGIAYGFDALSGEVLWSYDLGAGAQGGISIIDGTAYVGFGGGGPPDLKPTLVGGITAFSLPEG